MSHKGRLAAHVGTLRSSLLGGSNTMAKTNHNLPWNMIKNEDPKGANLYSVSHPEIAKLLTERKRDIRREQKISKVPFDSTILTSNRKDDMKKV